MRIVEDRKVHSSVITWQSFLRYECLNDLSKRPLVRYGCLKDVFKHVLGYLSEYAS